MDNYDNLTSDDIDEIVYNMNKNRPYDKTNTSPYTGDNDKLKDDRIVNELVIGKRGNPKGNRKTLKVTVSLKSTYKYMNSMINYLITLNRELKHNDIIEKGLNELDKDDAVLKYSIKLNDIRKNSSICTTFRFSAWDSRDEDFHFLYEHSEIYNITYSTDNDIRIGNISHDLKLHKHKVIGVALNYGAKVILSEYNSTDNMLYKQICEEINWFQGEYNIKTINLSLRFENVNFNDVL